MADDTLMSPPIRDFFRSLVEPTPVRKAPTSDKTILSADEQAARERLEQAVDQGVSASLVVLEAGKALHELRSRELYRDTHKTWASYVEARFRISRRRADQMVAFADLHTTLEEMGTRVPDSVSETAIRPLAGLSMEDQVEAFQEAAASPDGVTKTTLRRAAAKRKGKGKAIPKARRFRVPGATVLVAFNAKSDGSVIAALHAAIRQVEAESAGREAA